MKKKLWTRNYILFIISTFMVCLSSNMLNSPLPRYVMRIGGDNSTAGIVTGLFALSACVCRPLFGRLLDTKGRRLILVLGIAAYCTIIFSYNWAGTIAILLAIRFMQGIGMSAYSTAQGPIAADLLSEERMVEGFGYYSVSMTIASSIGPTIGLGLAAGSSYSLLFNLAALASLFGLGAAIFLRYEEKKPIASQPSTLKVSGAEARKKIKAGILEKTALPSTVVIFFASITTGTVMTFLSPYAATRGIESIGLYFTINAVALFLTQLSLAPLTRWVGTSKVIILGLAAIAGSMVLLCFSSALYMFLIAAVINGLGTGVLFPVINSLVVMICPQDRKGAANATYNIGVDVGIGGGAILGGVVAQAAGYPALFALSAASVAVALIVYQFTVKRQIKQDCKDAALPTLPAEGC